MYSPWNLDRRKIKKISDIPRELNVAHKFGKEFKTSVNMGQMPQGRSCSKYALTRACNWDCQTIRQRYIEEVLLHHVLRFRGVVSIILFAVCQKKAMMFNGSYSHQFCKI
ncbi:hypothetical protein CDAR_377211 [Caerostris darwini]|uniref:Uncharacterized protein n=1 Tax=Caerostris darwini TaxID=1538125 RepID=A0AAV4T6T4_9ARAC|nr:hypothetical protein CDAR_377211 [Caerostris darwini]